MNIVMKCETMIYHAQKLWIEHLEQKLDKHWLILLNQLVTLLTKTEELNACLPLKVGLRVIKGKKTHLTSVCTELGRKLHTFLTASSISASVAFFSRMSSMYLTAIMHTSQ